MTTRWEVETAVQDSRIEPTGRHVLLALLTKSTAGTAEIPPKYAPSYTDLERLTGLSRSALTEWMRALTDAKWVRRLPFEGESKEGFALSVGDPNASRAPRIRTQKTAATPSPVTDRALTDVDIPYRLAVHPELGDVPAGGTDRTAERHDPVSPGGTNGDAPIRKNSPTESSLTTPTLTGSLFEADADHQDEQPAKKPRARKPKNPEAIREDVQQICTHLAEAVVANGSKRPTINDKWRAEARLLLDEERDPKATVERVVALIDWIKTSDWWKAKVLAMPKLRAKYDEIRLDAVRDYNRKKALESGSFNGSGYRAQKVNHDEPGQHTASWDRRRANAQQQQ